jgi:hypothetical protein
VKVEFSDHALDRVADRFPRLGLGAIAREIDDAIAEGRISHTPPSWRLSEKLPQKNGNEFAWSRRRERIYVLARRRRDYVLLVTCIQGSLRQVA